MSPYVFVCLCMRECTDMYAPPCGGQRASCGSGFSPSAIWVLRLQVLVTKLGGNQLLPPPTQSHFTGLTFKVSCSGHLRFCFMWHKVPLPCFSHNCSHRYSKTFVTSLPSQWSIKSTFEAVFSPYIPHIYWPHLIDFIVGRVHNFPSE